ncbi:MAG: copper transporter [Acidimicrobiales bacterium]
MVNFRFHLISLTAVFLALAIGMAVGATVVDRATVDALQSRLNNVATRVDATDAENTRLARDLGRWTRFAAEGSDVALAGRLDAVPVLVLAVEGVDRRPVDQLNQALAAAGARLEGMAWFTGKLRLDNPDQAEELARLLGTQVRGGDSLRRLALSRLAGELAAETPSPLLAALAAAAFVQFESAAGDQGEPVTVPQPGTRFVVVSGAGAEVRDEVLAAEPGRDAAPGRPAQRARFVGLLRDDPAVASLLSTIDNLEDFRGRFSAVYALRDLAEGKVGQFGVGPKATRLVPETAA